MGAGEINEETEKQLAEAQEELKSLKSRVSQLEDENAQLRSRTI